jgi:translation initiation factor 1
VGDDRIGRDSLKAGKQELHGVKVVHHDFILQHGSVMRVAPAVGFSYNYCMSNNNRTVWSSDAGDLRKKNQNVSHTRSLPTRQQTAYLHRESGGRGGKVVSVVKNLILTEEDLKTLAKILKQECGTGGTVKEGMIEIQGEHRQRMAEVLQKLGYKVKIAGG